MRIELTFKDGTSIALLEDSSIEPSTSLYIRNKLRLYVIDGNVASFVAVFSNKDNLDDMYLTAYIDNDEILYEHHLEHYTLVSDIGRKLFQYSDAATGELISEYRLVAVIEQPTPIEREEPVPDPETEEIINILLGGE